MPEQASMDAVSYSVIHNDIHVFVFANNEPEAVDAYVRVWHEEMPNFWRHSPQFNQVLRVLLDLRRSGPLPWYLIYDRMHRYPVQFPDRPDMCFAYLMHPAPGYVSQVQTMATMIGDDRVRRRFFGADERDVAIAWLKSCPQDENG